LTFIAIKVALLDLGPYTLAFGRFVIATLVLSLAEKWRPSRVGLKALPLTRLSLMGLLGVTLFVSLQNLGLIHTTASSASLILSSIPAITAIICYLALGEPVSRVRTASIAVSIVGVALIILGGSESSLSLGGRVIGDLLILVCAFFWACYTVIGRDLMSRLPYLTVTWVSTAFGTLFLFPLSAYEYVTSRPMHLSPPTITALLFLGLVASALAFLLYNFAVSRVGAGEATIYVNLSPLVTVCAASLMLHESLTLLQAVGGIIVLSSLFLASK
jgi:drug/metabolite transporter (DMT)-like permease